MDETKCCTVINNQYYGCCGGNGVGVDNVYSTEETVCGTWIDGKTIYRKVIEGKLAAESGNAIVFADVSGLGISDMIDLYGHFRENSGTVGILQTSSNRTNGLFSAVNMFYSVNTKLIYYHFLNNTGNASGAAAYVVLEYTKQDTAATA